MLKEEKYLNEVMGRKNPFRVPEGYFDDFADRMMEMLPEKEVLLVSMLSPVAMVRGWS